ncbi:type I restriction enzyme, S subunit [Acetomicrobium thermoterrenum DSM 13490]|uniref:Type I restriction enzyme, S subunit n=1 Tax=Acetomicrobium thermoterrenum DSM 13490 TaxID=1120987 RepID=A0A1H3FU91_9BACT|nr:restriction endonuclease subunit S [Acetomicrobium thermoterrenum]SDX94500.1 type I restriction enzyme, S subunit [Acetomicrobium thermoterrenum DSM 13490]
MITKLKPYPAYKESGMPWLGQVPEHWEVLPGRAVFREINDRGHPDEQMLSVTITRGVLRQADLLADSSKKDSSNEDKSNYKLVQPGDLVYNKMRAWQGAVGVSAYRGIVSPAYIVQRLRSAENLPRYMHFLLRTPLFASEAERWSYGITSDQWSLRAEEFKCIYFSLPPLPEQTAIVRFLDWAEQRIRRVIRARQRRIKLLEEYKQALIHQAVTGSIDVRTGQPYPVYKPSGVEWLGQVPEHWEVRRLKTAVDHINEQTSTKNDEDLYIALEHVESWTGRLLVPSGEAQFDSQVKRFRAGDVLFGKLRPYLAKVVRPKQSGVCVGEFFVLRARLVVAPHYLEVVLRSAPAIDFVNSSTYGAKMPRADWTFVGAMRFPLPPLPEQNAIVEYLDTRTTKIDAAIAATRSEIELLREYRTRLIADVVTGKVDVREVAAQLPEEPPEEEAESMDADEIAGDEATDEEAGTETVEEEEVEP